MAAPEEEEDIARVLLLSFGEDIDRGTHLLSFVFLDFYPVLTGPRQC
jgi:hypothetical protein